MPGFLVLRVLRFAEVGGEDDGGLVSGGLEGEDVPGVGGDDEGGDEIELVGLVGDMAGTDGADVGMLALVPGALDLDAEEVSVVVDGEVVVGGGVSPGLGQDQAVLGGALHETELRPLAPELGVRDVDPLLGHECPENAGFRPRRNKKRGLEAGRASVIQLYIYYINWK